MSKYISNPLKREGDWINWNTYLLYLEPYSYKFKIHVLSLRNLINDVA